MGARFRGAISEAGLPGKIVALAAIRIRYHLRPFRSLDLHRYSIRHTKFERHPIFFSCESDG